MAIGSIYLEEEEEDSLDIPSLFEKSGDIAIAITLLSFSLSLSLISFSSLSKLRLE